MVTKGRRADIIYMPCNKNGNTALAHPSVIAVEIHHHGKERQTHTVLHNATGWFSNEHETPTVGVLLLLVSSRLRTHTHMVIKIPVAVQGDGRYDAPSNSKYGRVGAVLAYS